MFLTDKDLGKFQDLEQYRNTASKQLTFRKCVLEMSQLFLREANGGIGLVPVTPAPQPAATPRSNHVPNDMIAIRRKTEDVSFVAKETGCSPKRNVLKRLDSPITEDESVASKRFKSCPGLPFFRVGEEKGDIKGAGGQGLCIVCDMKTNWYCFKCRNWCCADRIQPEGAEFIRDVNTYKAKGGQKRHITARYTCFMSCHPRYMDA